MQSESSFGIRSYTDDDQEAVIRLWKRCNLIRPSNDPQKDILRKCRVNPELFLVGTLENKVVATVMGGYEGHRGWANYLAVDPQHQKRGFGKKIMTSLEEMLIAKGCPKINLQVRRDNQNALNFYSKIGFKDDDVISLGKRLIYDE
jgi:ribosomal protein S18 acetylase RimI-like enzyme